MMKKLCLFEKGVFKNCTDLYHNTDRKWQIRDNVSELRIKIYLYTKITNMTKIIIVFNNQFVFIS